jgi:predicted dehydrogenase
VPACKKTLSDMLIDQTVSASRRTVGIAMNGVTGRMGTNQHLLRSIVAIRDDGGIPLGDGTFIWPEPILVGRNEEKLRTLASQHGIARVSTDLDAVLADPSIAIYFDALTTSERPKAVLAAIAAGKHVYVEKPIAPSFEQAMELVNAAHAAGVKNGVVHDKLYLPGFRSLRELIDDGFFGRILSVRGEFGYWVFEGTDDVAPQRPSWNYRAQDGGGIIVDMFAHWRYVMDDLFGRVTSVAALGTTHVSTRVDENGRPYEATADDAAYATFELEGGIVAHINSSWCVRVNRDELVEFQVDGTEGSAVAGLRNVKIQKRGATPRATWNPDVPDTNDYPAAWAPYAPKHEYPNGFRAQWEQFLRHVVLDESHPYDFLEGAKGVQLSELGMQAWRERRTIEVPKLA